jgi:hypothetical protein
MPEDIQEQEPSSQAPMGVTAAAPDVADEEDLDVVLERVVPKRSGGLGLVGWVLGIVIVGVVGTFFYMQWDAARKKAEEQARVERQVSYDGQEQQIMAKVERAAKDASAGHIDAAVDVLEAAAVQWGQIAQGAQAQGDADVADNATRKKEHLGETLKGLEADRGEATKLSAQVTELEAQIKGLQGKQDEINARVRDAILKFAGEAPAEADGKAAPAAESKPAAPAADGNAPDAGTEKPAPADEPKAGA